MNSDDSDRSARTQVTLRLEQELLERIDEIAAERRIDRTELIRRLLHDGVAKERREGAVAAYAEGRASLWAAAAQGGLSVYEMIERVAEAGTPYRIEPEVLKRLGGGEDSPAPGGGRAGGRPAGRRQSVGIEERRTAHRPGRVRLLLVGESSPAGGLHFYLANSNLYRATREALAAGLAVTQPPEGDAFLAWFRDLGCWLVDLADRPVNHLSEAERRDLVRGGIPRLSRILRDVSPERVVAVISSIGPAVRQAAREANYDESSIDVLPFPVRQWRPVYVAQLAVIVRDALGPRLQQEETSGQQSVAEEPAAYGTTPKPLHDAIRQVLVQHGGGWVRSGDIAREIREQDLWRRPSDGRHPPPSQISARARQYPALFQISDLGVRLR